MEFDDLKVIDVKFDVEFHNGEMCYVFYRGFSIDLYDKHGPFKLCFDSSANKGGRFFVHRGKHAEMTRYNDVVDVLSKYSLVDGLMRIGSSLEDKLKEFSSFKESLRESYLDDVKKYSQEYGRTQYKRYRKFKDKSISYIKNAKIPNPLSDVKDIKLLNPDIRQCGIVYFLLKGDVIVYVGQTTQAWPLRIQNHYNDAEKEFDSVWYLENIHEDKLDETENFYIKKYSPQYNKTIIK